MKCRCLFIFCILGLVIITGLHTSPAFADVPDVLDIEPWTSGNDTVLNITVRHASPTSSHYVDRVEVDVDEVIQNIDLGPPQSAPTFVVQYNMGEITGTPQVQARANCNFHGWSSWSQPILVPEFSTVYLFLILALVSFTALLLKDKIFL